MTKNGLFLRFAQHGIPALLLLLALGLAGCKKTASPDPLIGTAEQAYGSAVNDAHAVLARAVSAEPSAYVGDRMTVEGRVSAVCQKKGCWLALDAGHGAPIRVSVPRTDAGDYVFTVPTDLRGWATVTGTLEQVMLDASTQQHLADDGAASTSATELHLAAAGITVRPMATAQ